jgi:hypothetical protein
MILADICVRRPVFATITREGLSQITVQFH